MIPGTVHRSTGIYLIAVKNRKTSARRQFIKAVGPVIASYRVPYLQMRSVGSHSRLGEEERGRQKGKYYSIHK